MRRKFGWPGRIDAHERVWLTFAGIEQEAEVHLNGARLSRRECEPFEFDVTHLLLPRNELIVDLTADSERGGLWGEVALEARCLVFLRGLTVWATEKMLIIEGEYVGAYERPLDLYILLDGKTVHYSSVLVNREHSFRIAKGGIDWTPGAHVVRVELVDGATLWFKEDLEIAT